MNSDQKMIATLGMILILFVLFGVYRKTISAILFNAPPQNTSIGPNLGSGGWLNGITGGLLAQPVTPTDQTNGASTNNNPTPQPTMTITGPQFGAVPGIISQVGTGISA